MPELKDENVELEKQIFSTMLLNGGIEYLNQLELTPGFFFAIMMLLDRYDWNYSNITTTKILSDYRELMESKGGLFEVIDELFIVKKRAGAPISVLSSVLSCDVLECKLPCKQKDNCKELGECRNHYLVELVRSVMFRLASEGTQLEAVINEDKHYKTAKTQLERVWLDEFEVASPNLKKSYKRLIIDGAMQSLVSHHHRWQIPDHKENIST